MRTNIKILSVLIIILGIINYSYSGSVVINGDATIFTNEVVITNGAKFNFTTGSLLQKNGVSIPANKILITGNSAGDLEETNVVDYSYDSYNLGGLAASYYITNGQPLMDSNLAISNVIGGLAKFSVTNVATGTTNVYYFPAGGGTLALYSDLSLVTISGKIKDADGIAKGRAVYISGGGGSQIYIKKSSRDNSGTLPVVGITMETGVFNGTVDVAIFGPIQGLSLPVTTFAEGDLVYLGTNGVLDAAPTLASDAMLVLGTVTATGPVNGRMEVNINSYFQDGIFAGSMRYTVKNASSATNATANFFVMNDGGKTARFGIRSTNHFKGNGFYFTGNSGPMLMGNAKKDRILFNIDMTDSGTDYGHLDWPMMVIQPQSGTASNSFVGIGTTNPLAMLDVAGFGRVASNATTGTEIVNWQTMTNASVVYASTASVASNLTSGVSNSFVLKIGDTMSGNLAITKPAGGGASMAITTLGTNESSYRLVSGTDVWDIAHMGDPNSVTQGLIAYYTLDNTAQDMVSGSLGTLNSGYYTNAAKIGSYALACNGSAGDLSTVNATMLNSATSFTINVWMNMAASAGWEGIVFCRGTKGFGLYMYSYHKPCLRVADVDFVMASWPGFPTNGWVMLTGEWDASTDTATIYTNGVVYGANTYDPGNYNQDTVLRIGRDSGAGGYFNGVLDDVRIYNRLLNANEKARLYNGFSEANELTFRHNGSDRLTVLDDGAVGIGTLTPSNKLVVVGNGEIQGDLIVSGSVRGKADYASYANTASNLVVGATLDMNGYPITNANWIASTNYLQIKNATIVVDNVLTTITFNLNGVPWVLYPP